MTMRVYEFSKKSEISSKDLLAILSDAGFDVKSHMSVLSDDALSYLDSYLKKKKEPEKEVKDTAIKEEKRDIQLGKEKEEKKLVRPKISKIKIESSRRFDKKIEQNEVFGVKLEPMMLGDFAAKSNKPVSEIILFLLRQGIMATKNQIISEDVVKKLAEFYDIPIIQPELPSKEKSIDVPTHLKEERMPVVVVIGHVDHGKTTLLDYIRKARVAEREKGGITQHLGAYQVKIKDGGLVFLDTPGHEAFSMMRARGVKIADAAILVVAADDGVMPQTIEAIKHAQAVEVPIIVALNKIDKASAEQIEKVKRELTTHGLVPEDWGGETVVMPISAKFGTGVDELLEMVVLQTKLLELQTDSSIAARGFVLESKIEKGLGPVATIICQYGTLSLGDYFRAGLVYGKASAIINSSGQRLKSVGPSVPVLLAGFSSLAQAGDPFEVVSSEEVKMAKRTSVQKQPMQQSIVTADMKEVIRIILKADNVSSLEALGVGIDKLVKNISPEQKVSIIHSGVGDINESDVILANDINAVIYGFHVKIEPRASIIAVRENVAIKLFHIIYKLFEDLEQFIEKLKKIKIINKKIGEAEVLKVFKIKGIGVIAGARVKSGRFVRDGNVEIYRGPEKIGAGPIRSLQREKQTVKEVQAGFECAFLIEGFNNWQPGDIVECYIKIPEE